MLSEANRDPLTLREKFRLEIIEEVFERSIKRFEEVVAAEGGTIKAAEPEREMWVRIFVDLGKYLSTVKENKREFINHFKVCLSLAVEGKY